MNILEASWIPVHDARGRAVTIAPHEIVKPALDAGAIAWPRVDLQCATLEFLVGVFQTTCAPVSADEWARWYLTPPTSADLSARLAPFASAFELLGDGPRFLQDRDIPRDDVVSVTSLLIDSPGENTLKKNADLFVKRTSDAALSEAAAAISLFALQAYAPAGGAGNRTGMRGGGPLTTLLVAPRQGTHGLWRTIWLNVLPANVLHCAPPSRPTPDVFPWMGETCTSETHDGEARTVRPNERNALQAFWGMPRRIWLHAEPGERRCFVTGERVSTSVTGFSSRPFGASYAGWSHPLTPYRTDAKKDTRLPLHPSGSIDYRDWLGYVHAREQRNGQIEPAAVVQQLDAGGSTPSRRAVVQSPNGMSATMLAFGYDMDNMKARRFVRSVIPDLKLYTSEFIEADVARLVEAADFAASMLRTTLRDALFGRNAKGDASWIDEELTSRTESSFRQAVEALQHIHSRFDEKFGEDVAKTLSAFGEALRAKALAIFSDHVDLDSAESMDMERVIRAQTILRSSLRGEKFAKRLGLNQPPAEGVAS